VEIAIVAIGEMGQGVARRLRQGGAAVATCLQGRSAHTAMRAADAGVAVLPDDDALVRGAAVVLSIVPPGEAFALARRLAAAMRRTGARPAYVDCNAISADTMRRIGEVLAETGAPVVDVGIIGPPPGKGATKFYASGPPCAAFERLKACGLDVRWIGSALGEASTLKMCYGGLTKGLTALATTLLISARRAGVDQALAAELADSRTDLLPFLDRFIPSMPPKAYRWVAEMEEGAAALARVGLPPEMLAGAARLYEWIANARPGEGEPAGLDPAAKRKAVIERLADHLGEKREALAAAK
jgi:3-hydroxyisobutyrate dehydrogenase-like beta-hydroxyacid dehydrogenase